MYGGIGVSLIVYYDSFIMAGGGGGWGGEWNIMINLRSVFVAELDNQQFSSLKSWVTAELQIRGGIKDNSKIIFSYFSMEIYVVTLH